jgi:hypothetical protein
MGSFAAGAGTKYLAFTGESPSFTNATVTGNLTLSGGTANGVLYLNGSKVVSSGTGLTFDGTATLRLDGGAAGYFLGPTGEMLIGEDTTGLFVGGGFGVSPAIPIVYGSFGTTFQRWLAGGSEAMRLNSTGLGIGTNNPESKLHINTGGNTNAGGVTIANAGNQRHYWYLSSNTNSRFEIGSALGSFSWSNSSGVLQTLDASGNLGLGVTPSQWASGFVAAQVLRGSVVGNSNRILIGANWAQTAGGERYIASDFATIYSQDTGQHRWYNAPSGTAGNAMSLTQAMTLDASGNLLVGLTGTASAKLNVRNNGSVFVAALENQSTNTDARTALHFYNDTGYVGYVGAHSSTSAPGIGFPNAAVFQGLLSAGVAIIAGNASGDILLQAGGTSSGNLRLRVKAAGQVRFVPLAAAPTVGVEDGDVYYNSTTNKLQVRAAGAWVDLH